MTDTYTNKCFFVVYCIYSTVILNLFENMSSELWEIYELYRDIVIGDVRFPLRSRRLEVVEDVASLAVRRDRLY